jgi:hypothetical protein
VKSPQDWLSEQQKGKPGSAKRLAYEFRNALTSVFAYPIGKLQALERLTEALESHDSALFRQLADGMDELAKSGELDTTEAELCYCLCMAHPYLSCQKEIPFNKQTLRALTVRIYCTAKEIGSEPALPLPEYPQKVQKRIESRIIAFSKPKWSRIDRKVDLAEVPEAKRGRKKKN